MALHVTLRQLQFLQEVARHGGFTRAGEALLVSQPTVSSAIGELERQVGLPLFQAVGRRVRLTEAGRVLNAHGERMLAELAEADRAMEGLRGGECGRLVVGASSTPGTYLLPPRLGAFRREHPGVELSLEIGDTHEVLERVLDGRLDLGVVGETQFETSLEAERFGSDHLVLILSPGHPLGAKSELTPEDLADEPFVLREKGSSTREVLERALEHHGITPRVVMELGNPEAIKKSVAAGLGISFVSEHAVELEVRAGVLAARRVRGLDASRGIFLVRRRSLRPAPLLERLLTALRA